MSALPPLPPAGQRLKLPRLPGSADALVLAGYAGQARLLVLTETAQDAARLAEEIAWFAPQLAVSLFPDWETLPYDPISPHPDLVSERLAALWQASEGKLDVLVAPAATATQRLAPPAFLAAHAFLLKQGDKVDVEALRARLTQAGYSHVNQVLSPGEFAVRGGLIDIFPMGTQLPFRLDLFDQEVESIRTFDPDSQRTLYKLNEIRLLPAREFPLDEAGITHFRQSFRDRFEGDPSKSQVYKDVSNALAPGGVEYYLPLFFDDTATLFDYLPGGTALVLHGDIQAAVENFWRDTQSRHRLLQGDKHRPLLPPEALFLAPDVFFGTMRPFARLEIGGRFESEHVLPYAAAPAVEVERRAEDPFQRLKAHLASYSGATLLVAESLGRRETMLNALTEYGLKPELMEGWFIPTPTLPTSGEGTRNLPPTQWGGPEGGSFWLTTGPLAAGFVVELNGTQHQPRPSSPQAGESWSEGPRQLTVLTETELYARSPVARRQRQAKPTQVEGLLRDLSELKIGDPVVHVEHGIGRYLGLTSMDYGDGETEFLTLEYAGGDKLYVPVAQLQLIARYMGGDPDSAPLHKLGSGQWEKAKRRAMEKARDTAAELLNLYAQRAARQGRAFQVKAHDLDAFAEGFGFEETPDQLAAIEAVIADMRSGKPMDRLVCGDVGFGKTEVALRAAFVAVADGAQVAVLCPTTLLAEQHFQTFADRFADFPVKLAELSRFRSAKEVNAALAGLAAGRIDIVIGTHKLLSEEVKFKNLGLVIIDEEHRFGVRQKERLKALRAEVDVLTLTATPIPRTLAMSLEGIRDFSVIATAPQKRLAIKTFVQPFSDGLIREAALRELKRGGQIYFLHNEVETIAAMRDKLARLLPEARIEIAHGQMPERELEHVMRDFYHQRFNLLLCTTIIETGINVPSANTILINRADKFGLAQLHQLRGRVGRSHHQAYAYLLTPPGSGTGDKAAITPAARKRLEAIQSMEELGSGFYLAMHDLEIRGAGEVLGEEQSGEMQEVGFSLFNDMLNQAVKSLKSGKEPDMTAPLAATAEINLHIPALLPEHYCADVHERLVLYKRLANCANAEELDTLQEELIDRFGLLPEPAQALMETHRLRLETLPYGIRKLDAGPEAISIQFVPDPPIDPMKLIKLIQTKREYKLAGQDRIRLEKASGTLEARLALLRGFIKEIA
ncbi:transcription-repair coupling factor [Sulfuritortus calidifontis]|uniref:Transcription-repair-coupling factor n=1 Tax=Sulfuritortus calidifontis TaxID=1914471 RepID=A0A4R3JUK3_9PROT|nr:transcription-repair coupling factor [Sulfuritortus calidifontis]TCS71509.1 transcription-repair coupling factor [Sulfuritortus calidifontis]